MSSLLSLTSCLLLSLSADAAQSQKPESNAPQTVESRDGRRTLARLPVNLARATVGLFSRDGLPPLLIGASLTALGSRFDDEVRERVSDPGQSFGRTLETIGGGPWSALLVTGLFAASRSSDHPRFRDLSYDLLDGFFLNGAITISLKETVRRERPNQSNRSSFPSGHTSSAFVLATVAERHYGWKAGVPAYAFAAAMGLFRIQRDQHYLSDVLAGGTLGYIVGRSVVRWNGAPLDAPRAPQVSVAPLLGRSTRALAFSITF